MLQIMKKTLEAVRMIQEVAGVAYTMLSWSVLGPCLVWVVCCR